MLRVKDIFKEAELTPQEKELAAMDDQIYVYKRLLVDLRQKWEDLGSNGRNTEKGMNLEIKIANLEIRITNLNKQYKKKELLYKDQIYYRETSCTPNVTIGRVFCIVAIMALIVSGIIISFGN